MTAIPYVIAAISGLAALYFLGRGPWKAYRRARGLRVIRCPENEQPAAVRVAAGQAAAAFLRGAPELRLKECTRWPEKRGCGQECLTRIEAAPGDCLVRTMVTRWYGERSCTFCGRSLAGLTWHERQPGLLGPDGTVLPWGSFAAEALPGLFATCRAVCWDCLVAEDLRRRHPGLVTERPGTGPAR